jgi:hypothetical protein
MTARHRPVLLALAAALALAQTSANHQPFHDGPRYYKRWPYTVDLQFPLAVWIGNPANVDRYVKELGVNFFFGLWERGRPLDPQLQALEKARIPVATVMNAASLRHVRDGAPIVGWIQWEDEPDRAQADPGGGFTLQCTDPE